MWRPSLGVGAAWPACVTGTPGGAAPPAMPDAAWSAPGAGSVLASGRNAMPLAAAAAATSASAATDHFVSRDMLYPGWKRPVPCTPAAAGCAHLDIQQPMVPLHRAARGHAATRHVRLYTCKN